MTRPLGDEGEGQAVKVHLRQTRLADTVASILRERIISGALAAGDLLPKQDALLEEFGVSRMSLREALRILELEGLLTVKRGNVGGAVARVPGIESSAYMLGLVLQARQTALSDVAYAIQEIEPTAAAACASREDRATEVITKLSAVLDENERSVDDGVAFTRSSRTFHETMVATCGNQTLIVVLGALELLWSEQERHWAQRAQLAGAYPEMRYRREVVTTHRKILASIERGDAEGAAAAARRHLHASQRYALADEAAKVVRATALRDSARQL
jgi:GntR family transcriptional repressor for pyruvate dehydrogenase complex